MYWNKVGSLWQNAARIVRGLFEIALRKGWPLMAGRLLQLSKIIERRLSRFNWVSNYTPCDKKNSCKPIKLNNKNVKIDKQSAVFNGKPLFLRSDCFGSCEWSQKSPVITNVLSSSNNKQTKSSDDKTIDWNSWTLIFSIVAVIAMLILVVTWFLLLKLTKIQMRDVSLNLPRLTNIHLLPSRDTGYLPVCGFFTSRPKTENYQIRYSSS